MQQLSVFDVPVSQDERKFGFRYRWNLLDGGEIAATCIPGVNTVTIMGLYHSSLKKLNVKISYVDYERFIEVTKLLEVGP